MRHSARTVIAAAGLIASTGTILAADITPPIPPKAQPVPYVATTYNWSGFYVGGHIGGAWSTASYTDPTGTKFTPLGRSVDLDGAGFLAGGQLGYNWQVGNWVFGAQGDASWTAINPSGADPFLAATTLSYKTDWLATLSGRVGYAWNNILVYGKGGAAWLHNDISGVGPAGTNAGNNTHAGWLAGGGLEYGLAPNWTAFVEYDFIGAGTNSIATTGGFGPATISFKQDVQMVKAGVNFKFNAW